MKICYISALYPPFIAGGAEIYVKGIAEKLVEKGHEVIVITINQRRCLKLLIEVKNGVKIYRIPSWNIYTLYNSNKKPMFIKPIWYVIDLWGFHFYKIVKNILKKEMPDVIHVHSYKGMFQAFNAAKTLNLHVIYTAHSYEMICPKAILLRTSNEICNTPTRICKIYRKIIKYLLKNKLDLLTAPSQFTIDKLKETEIFKDVKAIRLYNAIELSDGKKLKKSEKDYRLIDVLYVGGLSKHKGVHILINAFKELKYENIRLHIVGKGKDEDEFKKIAGSDKRIIFHGFKTGEELMNFYKKANVVVTPSLCYDNSPMVIYESLMNGTPVIGSRIGGIPELIEDGYNGFLFEAGNVDKLKGILENLVENPSELKRLEEGAFESVKKYGMKEHIRKLEELYKSVQR
ncbi:MAG: glycosyltransferase family 4 protein [Halobacteriota archaeon]